MQAIRSINYFRDTLNTALNYFGRKQKKIKKNPISENINEDLIEIIVEEEDEIPVIEPNNSLHNSYKLFYKTFPLTIIRDVNIRQNRLRDYYKRTFFNEIPQAKIQFTEQKNQLNENEIEEAFQHDLENNFETIDANDEDEQNTFLERIRSENLDESFNQMNIDNDQKQSAVLVSFSFSEKNRIFFFSRNLFSTDVEEEKSDLPSDDQINGNIQIRTTTDIPSVFTSPIKDEQSIPTENPASELFYDFHAENFHAEQVDYSLFSISKLVLYLQGAPFVCTTCNGVGHLKSECPELYVPNMIDLPAISPEWITILSLLCSQITGK